MSDELSAFSSSVITPKALARVMEHLGAVLDPEWEAWFIEREGHKISVELASEEIEDLEDELIAPLVDELRKYPRSKVALVLHDSPDYGDGEFEHNLARAVAIALAENWPIVLDDHAGEVELIRPPTSHR